RSIRNRLISYFTTMSIEQGNNEFTIPFSRQQLADYLSVDRSALSNELSKMQKDGIITYKKNRVRLNEDAVKQ
ncbi:MAG: winged helix-turn-helix domain-containing protein, partial [Clostridia bacterium]|nr:winged helix-turn-helix domain-containing protein [Clostridia bacterium]